MDTLFLAAYKNTPDGYLLVASVPPGETFAPAIFPGLTLDLAALMGEKALEEDPHE